VDTENIPPVEAAKLAVGDRIAAGFLPDGEPATVVYVEPYEREHDGQSWVFVAYRFADGYGESDNFLAHGKIPLESVADDGHGYSREPDEVTPEGRIPAHDGFVGEGGLTTVPLTDGESPVTWHFSFGHGQTDPDTGENLLGKYVTVVAPSYEACRTAMFSSRYGNKWSFDYDPDSAVWREWGPTWIEHERIDATGPATAEQVMFRRQDGTEVDVTETPKTIEDHLAAGGTIENTLDGRLVLSGGLIVGDTAAEPARQRVRGLRARRGRVPADLPGVHGAAPHRRAVPLMTQPSEPLSCRYIDLTWLLNAIDRIHPESWECLPSCDEPAAWSTFVRRSRDGQDVEIYTRTCEGHDASFHAATGYVRSVRLRQPKPDTTS